MSDDGTPENLQFDEDGLIPAIAQDVQTGEVRMLAYMNEEALEKTKETGFAHYWSRSRQELWKKGETSGNTQEVVSVRTDCDKDTILLLVKQNGIACHTGERNCFFEEWDADRDDWKKIDPLPAKNLGSIIGEIERIVAKREQNRPENSYTVELLEGKNGKTGQDLILEKIGEELTELILSSKNDDPENLLEECGDLLYHLLVLLRKHDLTQEDLARSLDERRTG